MTTPLEVLILEDRAPDAELMVRELRKAGYDVSWKRVESEAAFREGLTEELDIILADYRLPQYSGPRAMAEVRARGLDVPLIIVSGAITEEQAVETLGQGASDYILKDRLARLGPAVRRALDLREARRLERTAEAALRDSQARLSAVVANIEDAVWAVRASDFAFTYLSPGIERLTGRKASDFLADPALWFNVLHPEDRGRAIASTRDVFRTGSFLSDFRVLHADGSVRHMRSRGRLVPATNGSGDTVEGVLIDQTAQHTAEAERARAEEVELRRQVAQASYRELLEHPLPARQVVAADGATVPPATAEKAAPRGAWLTVAGRRLVMAAVAVAFLVAVLPTVTPSATAAGAVSNALQLAAAAIGAASFWMASRMQTGRPRLAFRFLAAACATWAAGQVAWTWHEVVLGIAAPFPSPADTGFLSFIPLALVAFILLSPLARMPARERGAVLLDVALAVVVGILAAWSYLLEPMADGSGPATERAVAMAYPLGHLVLLSTAAILLLNQPHAWRGPRSLLLLGLLGIASADALSAFGLLGATYSTGGLLDAGWAAGFLLLAAYATSRGLPEAGEDRGSTVLLSRFLPLAALFAVAFHIASNVWLHAHGMEGVDYAFLAAATALAALRQGLSNREAARLLKEHRGLADEATRQGAKAREALQGIELAQAAAHLGTWEYDHRADRLVCSAEMRQVLEAGQEPLDRARMLAHLDPPSAKDFAHSFDQSVARRESWSREGLLTLPGGHAKWVTMSAHHLYADDGRPLKSVGTIQDITPLKQAQDAARAAEAAGERAAALEQAERERVLFVNAMAHELNNPLTPMQLQVAVLKREQQGRLTPGQMQSVTILERSVHRMAGLVRDLLDVARIQASQLKIRLAPIDLAPVVDDTVAAYAPVAAQQDVTIEAVPSGPAVVVADAARVTQVVLNLLSNAVKFTPPGGRVTVSHRRDGDAIELAVTDTGAGLTPEQAALLFKPFSQVQGDAQEGKGGLGLGLYISKGIVEAHGGTLRAESPGPGKGSTFTVRLPGPGAAPVQAPPPVAAKPLPGKGAGVPAAARGVGHA